VWLKSVFSAHTHPVVLSFHQPNNREGYIVSLQQNSCNVIFKTPIGY